MADKTSLVIAIVLNELVDPDDKKPCHGKLTIIRKNDESII